MTQLKSKYCSKLPVNSSPRGPDTLFWTALRRNVPQTSMCTSKHIHKISRLMKLFKCYLNNCPPSIQP